MDPNRLTFSYPLPLEPANPTVSPDAPLIERIAAARAAARRRRVELGLPAEADHGGYEWEPSQHGRRRRRKRP